MADIINNIMFVLIIALGISCFITISRYQIKLISIFDKIKFWVSLAIFCAIQIIALFVCKKYGQSFEGISFIAAIFLTIISVDYLNRIIR